MPTSGGSEASAWSITWRSANVQRKAEETGGFSWHFMVISWDFMVISWDFMVIFDGIWNGIDPLVMTNIANY